MAFDKLIREGRDADALRYLADEYYKNGKMGHTRKLLLERVADRCDNFAAQIAEAQAKAEQAQEHKRLQNLVDSMAERLEAKDKQIKAKDYYIGLMAPYMAPVEAKKDVIIEEFAELLRAYRKATEGGEAE